MGKDLNEFPEPRNDINYTRAPQMKVVLAGASNAGKTSLLNRYMYGSPDPERCNATVNCDYLSKDVTCNGQEWRLLMLDTAGQERFMALPAAYYRRASAILFVFDLISTPSFHNLSPFIQAARDASLPNAVFMLIGTKQDLLDSGMDRGVSEEELRSKMEEWGIRGYMETSAKEDEGVREAFERVVEAVVESGVAKRDVRKEKVKLYAGEVAGGALCAC